jgi:hypothetical protein
MILLPLSLLLASMQTGAVNQQHLDPTLNLGPVAGSQNSVVGFANASTSPYGGVFNAGSIDSDDFNRASLGTGWNQMGGSFSIVGDALISGSGNYWIERAGQSVNYMDATTELDLGTNPSGLTYSAAVTGFGSDNLWTKVQSNGGGGFYDYIGFYHGIGAGGWGSYGGFFAITPVTGGHVRFYVTNGGDTMNIDIDEFNDGTYEYHYESSGILASFGATLGTGVGIGGYNAMCDNWDLGDGPGGPSYAITGLVGGGTATLTVSGATAGGGVLIGYSLTGAGPTNTPFGPVDMSAPITQLPTLTADGAGVATMSTGVPGRASGFTVYTQAADLGSGLLTNSLAEVVL